MEETNQGTKQLHRVKRGRPAKLLEPIVFAPELDEKAQTHALRVWSGQSPDVAVIDRVLRIVNALREQGLSLNIELPHPDAGRYLDAHK